MKILFVSHNATRTGAPLQLLNFIKWFKVNSSVPFLVLMMDGGPLRNEFEKLGKTFVYNDVEVVQKSLVSRFCDRVKPSSNPDKRDSYLDLFKRENVGMVYVNTATNGDLYDLFRELKCPILTHVHELESALTLYTEKESLDRVKRYSDHFIVNSEATKSNLEKIHNIPEDKLTVCYPFIPASEIINKIYDKSIVCAENNIPDSAFIVCGSGTTIWCKSPDIFIRLAHSVISKIPVEPVYFIWIGAFFTISYEQLQYDIDRLGLNGKVMFLGEKIDPLHYFAASNVFAQVSREDSFGLVSIEAAALAKPVACFDKSGGIVEFVEDDAGFIAPYLDCDSMAEFIIKMYYDRKLCEKIGFTARDKVLARHGIDKAAPLILSVIESML